MISLLEFLVLMLSQGKSMNRDTLDIKAIGNSVLPRV